MKPPCTRLAGAAIGLALWLGLFTVQAQETFPQPIAHIGSTPQYAAIIAAARPLNPPDPARAALGRQLFADKRLSQPQGTSCASCHDPSHAFTAFNGGRDGVASGSIRARLGFRNPPSLTYARFIPPLYFYQDDDAQAPAPFGGLMLDGRSDTLSRQAREPLLARHEMNLGTEQAAAARLRSAGYTAAFETLYGKGILQNPRKAVNAFGASLEAYLQSEELSPFNSSFDAFLRGDKSALNAQEMRGLAIFRNPDKGNCASCHSVSQTSANPARSLFTDFGYEALGAPRNKRLPSTESNAEFDLGLCKTAESRKWPDPGAWCGYFRTPSLRNVAARTRFMHNGVFDSLRETVRFYAQRSTQPDHWYGNDPTFNDIPKKYKPNINTVSTPLNRKPGTTPAMSEEEIDAVVAFLKTLTDKPHPGALHSAN